MNTTLEYALRYAKLGWHVFPCAPKKKTPLTAHGVKDATTDEGQIRKWWGGNPDVNIAVACGAISGFHVVDVDVDERCSGWDSLNGCGTENVAPETVRQNTPTGGAHLFYATDDPPANKNSFLPGIDIRSDGYYVILPPSVHPNGGVYAWADGLSPWDRTPSLWPDWLRTTQTTPKPSALVLVAPGPTECSVSDKMRRASAYLATCDPAVQGMGGHDKLLWAATAMVHGFLLSNSQTFDLLVREFNPRCDPPWDLSQQSDAKDFSRKITEARKLKPSKPSGWLLLDGEYAPLDTSHNMSDTKRKAFIAASLAAQQEQVPIEQPTPRSLEGEMHLSKEWQFITKPTGLLGDICSWMNQTSRLPQPLITLGCVLAFCGALFGRKIRTSCGLRTNLYCMGVGRSSAGKNHSRNLVRKLADMACCTELIGGDDFASDSSIERALSVNPSLIFLLDEVGHFMSYAKHGGNIHLHKIVPLLMKLYSCAGDIYIGREYAEEGKRRILTQPCCCIWGTTTPDEFTAGLTTRDIHSGWLSRCLVFRTDSIPEMNWDVTEAVPPGNIVTAVARWAMLKVESDKPADIDTFLHQRGGNNTRVGPIQRVVSIDYEADMRFRQLYYDSIKQSAVRVSSHTELWLKTIENAKKIALIVAASENYEQPRITLAVADYACRLVRFLMEDFCQTTVTDIFENPIDQKKQKIIAIIGDAGIDGIIKRGITLKTQSLFAAGRDRDNYLQDLIEAGIIYKKLDGKKLVFRTKEYQRKHLAIQGKLIT